MVSNDIVPIAQFTAGISRWFKNLQTSGHPLIITQNGKPAGVLLSPEEYDELVYQTAFLASVNKGLADIENGKVVSTEQLTAAFSKKRVNSR